LTSSSSSNEECDASSEEEVKGKKGRKGDKKSYNNISFNYDNVPSSSTFSSVPIGKAPHFDGMDDTKWKYVMKMHLISLSLSIWTVVCTSIDFPEEDEELGYEQLQQIHRNAQATFMLLSSLEKDEFDRVNDLEKAKKIWDTLQRSHEGTKPVNKAKIQLVDGQLDRFAMLDDESPQEMFNWLKRLVNKIRAYGSRSWSGQRMILRMLRAYTIKDTMVTSFIQQDPNFKRMTLDDVLERIINHGMLIEEVNHVKNLSKSITSSKNQDIAFKARNKGKSKKVVEESSSEEEDDDDESTEYDPNEMALFIKRFSRMMGKQKFFKGDKKDKLRTRSKRTCYNCDKYVHYIANCPYERRDEEDDKKKKKKKKKEEEEEEEEEKGYKKDKNYKKKSYVKAHIGKEWDSDDESSDSDSDGIATIAIKDSSSSSSKSLFPNLNNGRHTILMAKESIKKVNPKTSPTKYVSSDDELDLSDDEDEDEEVLLKDMSKDPKARIKRLLSQVGLRDELLEKQAKENNQELKKMLKLEKEKGRSLT
jgi:hypothetical protein